MFGFSKKVAAVAAGSLLAFAVGEVKPAQAVDFSFEIELTEVLGDSDPTAGDVLTGTFSFDEEFGVVEDGVESFDLTAFDFDFLGSSFDISSDSRVASLGGGFPTVSFDVETGEILGLDFFTESFLAGPVISFVPEDIVGEFQSSEFVFETASGGAGSGDVDYAAVPEPATVLGLVALGAGSFLVRKQQA